MERPSEGISQYAEEPTPEKEYLRSAQRLASTT